MNKNWESYSKLIDAKMNLKHDCIDFLKEVYEKNKEKAVSMFDAEKKYHNVLFYSTFVGKNKTCQGITLVNDFLFFVKYEPKGDKYLQEKDGEGIFLRAAAFETIDFLMEASYMFVGQKNIFA